MKGVAVGFSVKKSALPTRGERVAAWIERELDRRGMTISELAFMARVDKRDLHRLMNDRSIGWRLEDDLAAFFGWDFTEAVMTPVHGADPTTARERELEQRLAQAAALHERIERDRALDAAARPRLALVAGEAVVPLSQARGRATAGDPATPESA